MTNLQRYDNGEIELFIDQADGSVSASIKGTARMCGTSDTMIRLRITAKKVDLKMAEVPTTTGLKTAKLVPENLISELIQEFNPELALKMMAAGTRVYLYGLAGIKTTANLSGSNIDSLQQTMNQLVQQMARLTDEVREFRQYKQVRFLLVFAVLRECVGQATAQSKEDLLRHKSPSKWLKFPLPLD